MEKVEEIFDKYFRNNRENYALLERASFAYFFNRVENGSHNFYSQISKKVHSEVYFFSPPSQDNETCAWCGLTRDQIRWNDSDPRCQSRPDGFPLGIGNVIKKEEEMFLKMIENGKSVIPKILKKKFNGKVTADALFFLHTTHGYDPETVESVMGVDVDREEKIQYDKLMVKHREVSDTFLENTKNET